MADAAFARPLWRRPLSNAFQRQPVEPGERVDLAIVGGGIQGLSAALHAARFGLSVRVVEAGPIGQGASGLNGGQVNPGLKYDPDWLIEHFGKERGDKITAFAGSIADAVFDLIENEKLHAPHARNGWIQAAHTRTALANAERRDRQWRALGADVCLLDGVEIARLTGAQGYVGGLLDKRGGVIDPLAYTLELARVAAETGARIAESTRATRLRPVSGRWRVSLETGDDIDAGTVIAATNAYCDGLIPGLAETIAPLHSFQIATAPLPRDIADQILPEGQAVSDSRRILVYYRKSPDGRLMLGGRGRMSVPTGPQDWAHLEHALTRLYPMLAGVPVEKRWFGRVAMTPDHLPHIHEPEKGLIAAVGCQGRGVALMTELGARLADYAASGDRAALPFPISPIRPIPFHQFRQIGVAAMIAWYRLLDRIER